MILLNGLYLALEENYRNPQNAHWDVWLCMEGVFAITFTMEFLIKLTGYCIKYFADGWNCFDLFLVVSGIFGFVVSAMTREEESGRDVSHEARFIRLSRVLKVMRLLRLFRLLKFFIKLKGKLTKQDISFEVAEHMMKMNVLSNFMRAHLSAQKDFCRYFVGEPEDHNCKSVEVARCLIQSQVYVYRAAMLADLHLKDLDLEMLHQVQCVRESKVVVEELESFVMRAFSKGVISAREAESILRPLHHHIRECMALIRDSSSGLSKKGTSPRAKTREG